MKKIVLSLLVLLAPTLACAQGTVLYSTGFSDITNPNNAFFTGAWSDGNGNVGAGLAVSGDDLIFSGVQSTTDENVTYFFNSSLDLTSLNSLSLTAQLGAGNTATALQITLFDENSQSEMATFSLGAFSTLGYMTQTASLVDESGGLFDHGNVAGYGITGYDDSTAVLNIDLKELDVNASPVPEPATYATLLGCIALGASFVGGSYRRRSAQAV